MIVNSKFNVICCDPPYGFSDRLSMSDIKRSAQSNYSTMTIQEIKDLPIPEVADPNGCLLALWVPSSLLQDGLDIMQTWGFEQKQTYIWVKQKKNPLESLKKPLKELLKAALKPKDLITATKNLHESFNLNTTLGFGLGRLMRGTHELALIGINNSAIYQQLANKSQRSVSFAYNQGHSIKPEHLQNSLDLMFPKANKLEVFSRRQRKGWVCIGNQAPATLGEDIRDSLANLIESSQQCSNY